MYTIFRGGNIGDGEYYYKADDLLISKEFVKDNTVLNKNCFITPSVTSIEHIGKIALIDTDLERTVAGGFVLIVYPIYENINLLRYYLYALSSKYHKDNCKKITNKSGQAFYNLSREKLMQLLIPLPPLNEQRKISEKIKLFLPHIADYGDISVKLDNLNSNYKDALKKSILQYAIQGKLVKQNPNDEPADKLIERILDEKRQLMKDKKIKKENLSVIYKDTDNQFYEKFDDGTITNITDEIAFDIPNSWAWIRLGNIIAIKSGEGLTSSNMKKGNIPVYGGNGITGYHNESIIHKPTIVIGRVGFYCGSIHLTESEAWVTDNAFITTYPEKYIDRDYLIYMLKFLNLGKSNNATAQPVVSGKKIYPILAPVPPLKEQQIISNKLNKILNYIETAE